jgi:flagellar biosynthetic protein FlhB
MRRMGVGLAISTGLAFLAIAGGDYLFQFFRFDASLRMSRQEIVQEYKETEGDPLIKSRIRAMARALSRRKMLRDVPTADVVVTNPTRLAIALKYDAAVSSAPIVVAMGARKLADRIRALAREAGVPIMEAKPLAQALFATAKIGEPIPPALYLAVAEVLAFVYRQREKAGRRVALPAGASA